MCLFVGYITNALICRFPTQLLSDKFVATHTISALDRHKYSPGDDPCGNINLPSNAAISATSQTHAVSTVRDTVFQTECNKIRNHLNRALGGMWSVDMN